MASDLALSPKSTAASPVWLHHTGSEIHLLREIMRTQQAILGAFSREVGLPAARLALVRLLAVSGPDGVGVMDLARQLRVNAAAVTRHLAALEDTGLIARKPDPQDRRRASVRLTPKGLQLFEKVHARGHAFENALTAKLAKAEIAAAVRVLTAVRAAIESPA